MMTQDEKQKRAVEAWEAQESEKRERLAAVPNPSANSRSCTDRIWSRNCGLAAESAPVTISGMHSFYSAPYPASNRNRRNSLSYNLC